MTRLADRTAARREARLRRAELRVLAMSRAYADALDEVTTETLDAGDRATEALTALEAAALHYAAVAPRPTRRRRRARRR